MSNGISQRVEDFFSKYPLSHAPKEQVVVHAGEEPSGVLFLLEGKVVQYDIAENGDEIAVNIFKPFSFFPMSWAINQTPNDYFFKSLAEISFRTAPAADTVDFLKTNPDVMFDLLSRVYSGTEGMQRRMAHIMGGDAQSRMIYEILLSNKRYGSSGQNGKHTVAVNESDLANYSGLSRETISRQMSKIKAKGLVSIDRQGITIDNLAGLEKELGDRL